MQLPDSLPQRVKDLAREITAEGSTPYEKMELLQAYLRQNFEYTNKPDLSRRESGDFVDSFLFEIKQGYCDYYSTAMVIMARSLGVPARWVKGYAPGTQPSEEMMMRSPGISGNYTVSNADAHSWAELYFGDYGWIPFEATPGFDAPILLAEEDSVETLAPEPAQETETAAIEESFLDKIDPAVLRRVSLIALAVLLAWGLYQVRNELYFTWLRLRLGRPLRPARRRCSRRCGWSKGCGSEGLRAATRKRCGKRSPAGSGRSRICPARSTRCWPASKKRITAPPPSRRKNGKRPVVLPAICSSVRAVAAAADCPCSLKPAKRHLNLRSPRAPRARGVFFLNYELQSLKI